MWLVNHTGQTVALLLALTGLFVLLLGGPVSAPRGEDEGWLDAMMQAVLAEQASEGPWWGMHAPYVEQLRAVRADYGRGDIAAVYAGMNRFMDMLEQRAYGISGESADRLFNYCYTVTPARYHDVSRHIEKFRRNQFGAAEPTADAAQKGTLHVIHASNKGGQS